MGYTNINISYDKDTLCEEIRFTEPGEQTYTVGSVITLSDARLWRDRQLIVRTVNYIEDGNGGLSTEVLGFSEEYKYTRKAPNCDISFFSMTNKQQSEYVKANPCPDSKVYMKTSDDYGSKGWDMYAIVQKIVTEWMGLSVINNLPNFWICDFTISLGSTYFEAMTGLISVFEPFIILSGGTLYILGRESAGMMGGGYLTLVGTTSRLVNREYVPIPGCIRVEGLEGEYIKDKDVDCAVPITTVSGTSVYTDYDTSDVMHYLEGPFGGIGMQSGFGSWFFGGGSGTKSVTMTYDWNGRPTSRKETQSSSGVGTASITTTRYSYFMNGDLKEQVSKKTELFVYNSEAKSYAKYDARDHDPGAMASYESFTMIQSEVVATQYIPLLGEVYSVETITASKMWNLEEERWITTTTSSQDLVAAGDQPHISNNTSAATGKTLQVYAGDCPPSPDTFVTMDEPAMVFTVLTPCWSSIETCYMYLAALVAFDCQSVQVSTPIIDPLPLMSIQGLGTIIESGITGCNYVTGYNISIDANSGYTTELNMEARRGG